MSIDRDILTAAAQHALRAPSALNTQPWKWHVDNEALQLFADRERQLTVIDPRGKLVLLACGIALHHARISIAAAGYTPVVEQKVVSFASNPLARVTIGAPRPAQPSDLAWRDAIHRRRTDRRPFADRRVPTSMTDALAAAAAKEGSKLYTVGEANMPMLAVAVAKAGEVEMSDPAYRAELIRWTNRPAWSADGVPASTTAQHVPRRVPVRDLTVEPNMGVPIDPGGDRGAAYVVVYRDGDGPADWFAAGQATSAVLLAATALGLSTAPITDVIEVAHPRDLIAGLLPGGGHPFVVVRCGWSDTQAALAEAPRRDPAETIISRANA